MNPSLKRFLGLEALENTQQESPSQLSETNLEKNIEVDINDKFEVELVAAELRRQMQTASDFQGFIRPIAKYVVVEARLEKFKESEQAIEKMLKENKAAPKALGKFLTENIHSEEQARVDLAKRINEVKDSSVGRLFERNMARMQAQHESRENFKNKNCIVPPEMLRFK